MRLLDLFCGAGGATKGYQRAGFEVVGVDSTFQPRYCGDAFITAEALEYALAHGDDFDAIHASPPCQHYSKTRKILQGKGLTPRYESLVEQTRLVLEHLGLPWIIENVPGAPLRLPIVLCGTQFGLRVLRHRLFESNWSIVPPSKCRHNGGTNSHRGYSRGAAYVTIGGHNYNPTEGRAAMGIDWMARDELNEAIPPAYTEYIGRQLRGRLTGVFPDPGLADQWPCASGGA